MLSNANPFMPNMPVDAGGMMHTMAGGPPAPPIRQMPQVMPAPIPVPAMAPMAPGTPAMGAPATMGAPVTPAPAPMQLQPGQPHPWTGAPGQGLLQMLQRMQLANPDHFAQMMQSPMTARFGITPDNLAGMQSRQDIRQLYRPQHHMAPMAAAPLAPAGFAATPNPIPGQMT